MRKAGDSEAPSKRRRSEKPEPCVIPDSHEPAYPFNRWRIAPKQPSLGGAPRNWQLPPIKLDKNEKFYPAKSWEDAIKADEARAVAASAKTDTVHWSHGARQTQEQQQEPYQPKRPASRAHGISDTATVVSTSTQGSGITRGSGKATVVSESSGSTSRSGLSGDASTLSTRSDFRSHGFAAAGHPGTQAAAGVPQPHHIPMAASPTTATSYGTLPTGTYSRQVPAAAGHARQQPPPPPPPPPPAAAAPAPQPPSASAVVPKALLYQLYGRKPRRKQLSNEDYLSWNDGGRPHELKFTTIFQCPLTGECFPSGRQGDPRYYTVEKLRNNSGHDVEIVWYTKKQLAEHGAAARCYDCVRYREALEEGGDAVQNLTLLGNDPPYTSAYPPHLPPVPPDVAQKLEANRSQIHRT